MKSDFEIKEKIINISLVNEFGHFLHGYYKTCFLNNLQTHLLLYKSLKGQVPLRIQSSCLTNDIFHDSRCNCNQQLMATINYFSIKNSGLLIYTLEHEGKGNGYLNKLKVYQYRDDHKVDHQRACENLNLQPDTRDYKSVVKVIEDLGIKEIILLSSNTKKINAFQNTSVTLIDCYEI